MMSRTRFTSVFAVSLALAVSLAAGGARAEPAAAAPAEDTGPAPKPIVKDYCSSFVDLAAERRLTRLNDALKQTRDDVNARIEELKIQAAELKSLIDTRKAMQEKVGESLLKIYVQVEPEAAAQQLSKLEPNTAAEILVKMNPKRSGEILTLMDPKKAAALVALLTLQTSPEKVPKS